MSPTEPKNLVQALAKGAIHGARDVLDALKGAPLPGLASGDTRFVPPPYSPSEDERESTQGWGFEDTKFVVQPNEAVVLTGTRYNISNVELPELVPWISKKIAAPLSYQNRHPSQYPPRVPPPRPATALLNALRGFLQEDQVSTDDLHRLRHGHGHTGAEIWKVRYESLPRVPDLVVFPQSHDEVVKLVDAAAAHGAAVIPYGGGTNVTDALRCDPKDDRIIISVDMRRMNRVLWIDPVNRMACIEAGAVGRHIMGSLARYKLTMGHEPDSVEFSTLGGWIATNASGMKKNRYGNIEDIVLDMQVVTSQGVVSRPSVGPRESVGTNPRNIMFGSEGNLGIITTAVVKLFSLPEVQKYGSVVFPELKAGVNFLYDLSRSGVVPASVRLMDNTQFHFGQALKPKNKSKRHKLKSKVEQAFVTQVKGFDPYELAVATVVYEGTKEEVAFQEETLNRIASAHGGMPGGAANGERGYQLTFGIAYIRDLTFEHWAIAESFETSVPWSRALELYDRVKRRVTREHEARRLPGKPFFTGRFTQVYPTGVAVYFYLGFYAKGVEDPIGQYAALEHAAREEILASGGSLSHHHGVGKLRQDFMKDVYSEGALAFSRSIKQAVDPAGVFGARNHAIEGQVDLHAADKHDTRANGQGTPNANGEHPHTRQ
jgi:alkyldihydroxyacetonephosphate synthase